MLTIAFELQIVVDTDEVNARDQNYMQARLADAIRQKLNIDYVSPEEADYCVQGFTLTSPQFSLGRTLQNMAIHITYD